MHNWKKVLMAGAAATACIGALATTAFAVSAAKRPDANAGIELRLTQCLLNADGIDRDDLLYVSSGDELCYVLSLTNGTDKPLSGRIAVTAPIFTDTTPFDTNGLVRNGNMLYYDVDNLPAGGHVCKLIVLEVPDEPLRKVWSATGQFVREGDSFPCRISDSVTCQFGDPILKAERSAGGRNLNIEIRNEGKGGANRVKVSFHVIDRAAFEKHYLGEMPKRGTMIGDRVEIELGVIAPDAVILLDLSSIADFIIADSLAITYAHGGETAVPVAIV